MALSWLRQIVPALGESFDGSAGVDQTEDVNSVAGFK